MKRIMSFVTALSLFMGVFAVMPINKAEAAVWFSDNFETDEKLGMWKSIGGGSVEISEERQKIDKKSLKWTYETGNKLKLSGCDVFGRFQHFKRGEGFKLWIYSTNRIDDDMIVKIGKSTAVDDSPSYQFKVNMDFEGWRCIWARVNEFARTGNDNSGADALQLELPASMGEGVMYLDSFEVTDYVPYTACADKHITNLPITYTGYQYESYLKIPETVDEKQCLPEYKRAFRTMEKRVSEYILPEGIDYELLDASDPLKIRYDALQKGIKSGVKKYDAYNIKRRADGSMEGPGLTTANDTVGVNVIKFEQIWTALALDWKLNKNEDSKNKLMDLFDFFYEQGWAEGSAMGAMRFVEIRLVGYIYAVYLMRDELRETGRLERELANLRWRSEFGLIFGYDDPYIAEYSSVDADKIRSVVLFQFLYILSMEDTPEKAAYMKQYSKYLSDIILPRTGTDGGVKKDYTIWHHDIAFMAAYGSEALFTFAQLKYFMHDTIFDITKDATDTLSGCLKTYRESSNKIAVPIRLRGRYPNISETMVRIAPAYACIAMTGNREAAEVFLDIWDENNPDIKNSFKTAMPSITWVTTLGQLDMYNKVKKLAEKEGYEAAKPKKGTYIYPYGGYAVFRNGNYLAAVSGYSKYLWDFEGSNTENLYGRYMNYGSLTVISDKDYIGDGIDTSKGWDWARWPGTTAKHLDNKELEVIGSGLTRKFSGDPFLGGVAAENGNGIYAVKLHDTNFDPSFRANKSYFYFGDRIICLGSDITNIDAMHDTETILYQNVMGDDTGREISVNGETVTEFPYEKTIKEAGTAAITDINGNGYIIPDATGLILERRQNVSCLDNGVKSTGNLSLAYINHGKAPRGAGYEYVILPGAGTEKTSEAAKEPGYEVLKKDSGGHIVKDKETNAVGYVLFKALNSIGCGVVKDISRPCVIMETLSDNELTLNFSDPDLRIITTGTVKQKSTDSELRTTKVTVSGRWEMKEEKTDVRIISTGRDTTLEFDGKDGRQTDVVLVPVN